MEKVWSKQANYLAKRTHKGQTEDSIMYRLDEYREKKQELEALEIATPLELSYGNNYWYMSLRASPRDKADGRQNFTTVGADLLASQPKMKDI